MKLSLKLILASLSLFALAACSSSGGGGKTGSPSVPSAQPEVKLNGKSPKDYYAGLNYQVINNCGDEIRYQYLNMKDVISMGSGTGLAIFNLYLYDGSYKAYYAELYDNGDQGYGAPDERWLSGTTHLTLDGHLVLDGLGILSAENQNGYEGATIQFTDVVANAGELAAPQSLEYDEFTSTDFPTKNEACTPAGKQ